MPIDFEFKDSYNIEDLVNIVSLLRSPEGCEWDKAQTHFSIKKNFIEETYEAIEAINKNSPKMMREEFGDVLLQILLHCQMESEQHHFDFDDIVNELAQKLVFRHPHVFANSVASSEQDALDSWNSAKQAEKNYSSNVDRLDAVPKELPALMRAQKVQSRASKFGYDWKKDQIGNVIQKLKEEIKELEIAISKGNKELIEDEIGDILFSSVNISRFLNQDAEEVLFNSTEKFITRVKECERISAEKSIDTLTMDETQFVELWNNAKINLHNKTEDF